MSVLPPPLGRDSPMSIERIAPANQFHSQNTLQNAHNDRRAAATDGGGDGDGDGDVEMRSLNDRHPQSSACTLFPDSGSGSGFVSLRVPHPHLFGWAFKWARLPAALRIRIHSMSAQPH
jgi:hypothetical protein